MNKRAYRLAVDIGGTFTDATLVNDDTGEYWIDKVLTTPSNPATGFFDVYSRLAASRETSGDDYRIILHATTVATNALLERRGSRVGFLFTEGFRDTLEIGRQVRHELYNLQTEKPPALVPREWSIGIPERIDYRGEVVHPLDEDAVLRAVRHLTQIGVEALGICFLHSYINQGHERRAAALAAECSPGLHVIQSSEIAPEIREYWRASTTAVNAYIAPIVAKYLGDIEKRLERENAPPLHVMQSNGGVMTSAAARRTPFQLIESGPAAGVSAAAFFAKRAKAKNAISFDMGGTTAKLGLISDGVPRVLPEWEVASTIGSGTGLARGSGYPVLGSAVDLVEIGAGGGSVAWIDAGGLLRVGPHSAGADPGPAAYGKGGERPTVTDADLLLGRLNPQYFLGGELELDRRSAEAAMKPCADKLGLPLLETAAGIAEIADAAMLQAIRLVTIARGYDPRDFVMVAFGGAGPIHAAALIDELRLNALIVPPSPGVMSALGMLVSDLRVDHRQTHVAQLNLVDLDALTSALGDMVRRAERSITEQGASPGALSTISFADLRYVGQSWKLTVPLPSQRLTRQSLDALRQDFDRTHDRAYGFSVESEPVELVSIGVTALGHISPPKFRRSAKADRDLLKGVRDVWFSRDAGFVPTQVLNRYALGAGATVSGPAVIEERESTTLIPPGYGGMVDEIGALEITRAGS